MYLSQKVFQISFIGVSSILITGKKNIIKNDVKRTFYPEESKEEEPYVFENSKEIRRINNIIIYSPEILIKIFSIFRIKVNQTFNFCQFYYDSLKNEYFCIKKATLNQIEKLHDKNEKLIPNFMYIIISGLFGDIVSKGRGRIVRTINPIFFSFGALWFFFPKTVSNLCGAANKSQLNIFKSNEIHTHVEENNNNLISKINNFFIELNEFTKQKYGTFKNTIFNFLKLSD